MLVPSPRMKKEAKAKEMSLALNNVFTQYNKRIWNRLTDKIFDSPNTDTSEC